MHRQTDAQADRQTDAQADRQMHRQADAQTDAQTNVYTLHSIITTIIGSNQYYASVIRTDSTPGVAYVRELNEAVGRVGVRLVQPKSPRWRDERMRV